MSAEVKVAGETQPVTATQEGRRVELQLAQEIDVNASEAVEIVLRFA